MWKELTVGEEVAIVPAPDSPPWEAQELATVVYAGPVYVQLSNGLTFSTVGGKCLDGRQCYVAAVRGTDLTTAQSIEPPANSFPAKPLAN